MWPDAARRWCRRVHAGRSRIAGRSARRALRGVGM